MIDGFLPHFLGRWLSPNVFFFSNFKKINLLLFHWISFPKSLSFLNDREFLAALARPLARSSPTVDWRKEKEEGVGVRPPISPPGSIFIKMEETNVLLIFLMYLSNIHCPSISTPVKTKLKKVIIIPHQHCANTLQTI